MSTQQPLTREQLAKEYQWSQFPEATQERLYTHYGRFTHEGDLTLAERDIQSASDALSWVLQGTRLDAFLKGPALRREFRSRKVDNCGAVPLSAEFLRR